MGCALAMPASGQHQREREGEGDRDSTETRAGKRIKPTAPERLSRRGSNRERKRERERERERDQAAKLARAQGCVRDMADDCQQTQKARWKTARVLHSHGVRGPAQGGRSQEASGWPEAAESERLILEPVAPLRAWREIRSCVVSSGAANTSTAGKDPA